MLSREGSLPESFAYHIPSQIYEAFYLSTEIETIDVKSLRMSKTKQQRLVKGVCCVGFWGLLRLLSWKI